MAPQPSTESTPPKENHSDEDTLLESSLESFPASDPPAWVYGKDIPAPPEHPAPTGGWAQILAHRTWRFIHAVAARYSKRGPAALHDHARDEPPQAH